jgi:hypothetical protein
MVTVPSKSTPDELIVIELPPTCNLIVPPELIVSPDGVRVNVV